MPVSTLLYGFLLFRVFRLLSTHYFAHCLRPIPLSRKPLYHCSQVSMIVPTLSRDTSSFLAALNSWRANKPLEIIIVTTEASLPWLGDLIHHRLEHVENIQIHAVPKASKRDQLALGLQYAKGDFVVLADADVFWGPRLLPYLLACFEDSSVGGVGTKARAQVPTAFSQSIWRVMANLRFAQRFCHIAAVNFMDGGLSCLSGRTAAYRAPILQDTEFISAFINDKWRGKNRLDSGDDTFITRWIQKKGWKAVLQTATEADIMTSVFGSPKHLGQRFRWSRNATRSFLRYLSDIRLMMMHPYLAFDLADALMSPFCWVAFIVGLFFTDSATRLILSWIVYGILDASFYLSPTDLSKDTLCALAAANVGAVLIPLWAMCTLDNTSWTGGTGQ